MIDFIHKDSESFSTETKSILIKNLGELDHYEDIVSSDILLFSIADLFYLVIKSGSARFVGDKFFC